MAAPRTIPLSPGLHPRPPALPSGTRPPVLQRASTPAQRELPLRPQR